MFSKNFNIIIGDRASGRTTFLFELARLIKSFGKKTCYIGGTEEFYEFANNSVNKIYDSTFFYKNDVRLFQNIKENYFLINCFATTLPFSCITLTIYTPFTKPSTFTFEAL